VKPTIFNGPAKDRAVAPIGAAWRVFFRRRLSVPEVGGAIKSRSSFFNSPVEPTRPHYQPLDETYATHFKFSVAIAFLLIFLSLLALTHQAHAIVDFNQNGVSDLWEKKYNNGNLFPTLDPVSDADGNGWIAAQKAIAGTNPFSNTTPTGYLRPEFSHLPAVYQAVATPEDTPTPPSPETLSTHWTTLSGKQYTLQASADLTTGSWLAVGIPQIGRGQTTTQNVLVIEPGSTAPPRRFLRVAVAHLDRDSDTLMDAEEA
jgi:hypothetical protein